VIKQIFLKFTEQEHYTAGGIDVMTLIDAKFNTEQYLGLVIGDVLRYALRYLVKRDSDDLEKALTMLAWGVDRVRKDELRPE